MASDTKKITIEIIGKGSEKDGEKDDEKKQKSGKKKKKSDGQIWLSMVAQRAKEIVISTIETDASRYFYMKEDYLGETVYRNIKNIDCYIGITLEQEQNYDLCFFSTRI